MCNQVENRIQWSPIVFHHSELPLAVDLSLMSKILPNSWYYTHIPSELTSVSIPSQVVIWSDHRYITWYNYNCNSPQPLTISIWVWFLLVHFYAGAWWEGLDTTCATRGRGITEDQGHVFSLPRLGVWGCPTAQTSMQSTYFLLDKWVLIAILDKRVVAM